MNQKPQDPASVEAIGDPGDETQRNFRYQHGYGAILLINGAQKPEIYSAIWCEHHEDILAERIDGFYEAYQVKTRRPELGDLDLRHDEVKGSLERFVKLEARFPNKFSSFCLVSNVDFLACGLDIQDQAKVKRSPVRFLEAIQKLDSVEDLVNPFNEPFNAMVDAFSCDKSLLFDVLKKVKLKKGPPRENFDTEISHTYLGNYEPCKAMSKVKLNTIRDEIIQQVYKASSLYIDDPDKYLEDILTPSFSTIKAKRIPITIVEECLGQAKDMVFRYQSYGSTLKIDENVQEKNILKKKLIKGNLEDTILTMTRRTISSERRLFEKGYDPSINLQELLAQLESVVQAECDEAKVEATVEVGSLDDKKFGGLMYAKLSAKLKDIAENNPNIVSNEPFETLFGIAGLLTENCSVWWSDKFNVDEAA